MENLNWLLIALCSLFLIRVFKILRKALKDSKKIKKQIEELEKNKCKGPHKWININVENKNTHVCRECYWCPSYESYIKKVFVDAEIKKEKFEEDMESYKKQKLLEIQEKYGLKEEDVKDIYNKIINIKKDFTLKEMENFLKEIENKNTEK